MQQAWFRTLAIAARWQEQDLETCQYVVIDVSWQSLIDNGAIERVRARGDRTVPQWIALVNSIVPTTPSIEAIDAAEGSWDVLRLRPFNPPYVTAGASGMLKLWLKTFSLSVLVLECVLGIPWQGQWGWKVSTEPVELIFTLNLALSYRLYPNQPSLFEQTVISVPAGWPIPQITAVGWPMGEASFIDPAVSQARTQALHSAWQMFCQGGRASPLPPTLFADGSPWGCHIRSFPYRLGLALVSEEE